MATGITGKSHARQIQRKLTTVVRSLQQYPEIQVIFDALDEQPTRSKRKNAAPAENMMNFMFDESLQISYVENVAGFAEDIRKCINAFVKKTNDKATAKAFTEKTNELLMEHFNISLDTAHSSTTVPPTSIPSTPSKPPATKEEKAAMRSIVTSLCQHEHAAPFLHPVNEKDYPKYYDIVSSPMDLSTLKKKISNCSVDEFISNLNLIWSNCMMVNKKRSEIHEWGVDMKSYSDQLIHELLPSFSAAPAGEPSRKRRKSEHIETDDIDNEQSHQTMDQNDTKAFKDVLKALHSHELSAPFHYPVDGAAFPDYYEKIAKPMDYSTVKQKVKTYDRVSFYNDLNRIYTNCMEYNLPGSDIYKQAQEMQKFTNEQFISRFGSLPSTAPADTKKDGNKGKSVKSEEIASTTSTASPAISDEKAFKKIMKALHSHELSAPFHYPVDGAAFPDYYEKIAKPMDYSTVKQKVKTYDRVSFYNDLNRIYTNCMEYNLPGSDIYKQAQEMQKFTIEQFISHFGSLPTSTSNDVPVSSRDDDTKLMKKILQTLYANPLSVPFHYPVSAELFPDYYDKISNPVDYSTIKKNIKTYDRNSFYEDLTRVYANCMEYNLPGSDIYKQAKAMQKFSDTEYIKHFGSLPAESTASKANISATSRASNPVEDDHKAFKKILKLLMAHPDSEAFHYPVDSTLFPDYYQKISNPIDYTAIKGKLKLYDRQSFHDDLILVCSNCMEYNLPGSDIYIKAQTMLSETNTLCEKYLGIQAQPKRKNRRTKSESEVISKAANDKAKRNTWRKPKLESIESMLSRLSFEELARVVEQLDRKDDEPVLQRCKIEATYNTSKYDTPHTIDNHTVINFGEVTVDSGDILCPNHFSSSTALRIYFDICDGDDLAECDYSDITLDVDVTQTDASGVFVTVSSHNQHLISATSANSAAAYVFDNPKELLAVLGNAMRRCFGIFNVICSIDIIEPFLEPITDDEYYSLIKTPLCMRDIFDRFKSYDNVFDFCFDMKLVFYNCMKYNKNTSALYRNASTLLAKFDALFCAWVLNVQCKKQRIDDMTVSVMPDGPWEDWQYLKYFDAENKHINKCAATGVELPEDQLLFCDACENQYAPDVVQGTKEGRKWYCPRCSLARAVHYSTFELDADIVKSRFVPMECAMNVHEYVMSTNKEPLGWYRDETENIYMDPFGAVAVECTSSDVGAAKVAYQHMLQQKESDFKENKRRHRKKSSNNVSPLSLAASSCAAFEWYNTLLREFVDNYRSILPLHRPDVQNIIEGLPGFEMVGRYSQLAAIREAMEKEANLLWEKQKIQRASYDALRSCMEKERNFWVAHEVNFDDILTNPPSYTRQEHPQLSQFLNPFELNTPIPFATIVQLYDIIAAASNPMGYVCIGMWDLVECLSPKDQLQPSVVEFDELCCSLLNFLLHDLRRSLVLHDDLPLQKLLTAYTLNIVTWNHHMIDVLSIFILLKLKKYELVHVLAHLEMPQSLHQRIMLIIITSILSYVELTSRKTNKLLQMWMSRAPFNDFLAVLMQSIADDASAVEFVKCILVNYEKILHIETEYLPESSTSHIADNDKMDIEESVETAASNGEVNEVGTGAETAEVSPEGISEDDRGDLPSTPEKVEPDTASTKSRPEKDLVYALASRVERTLRCSLLRDSDSYTTEERIDILKLLTEFVSTTVLYREHRHNPIPQQSPDAFVDKLNIELCVALSSGKICPFTGICGTDAKEEWVVVPDYLLIDPTLEQPNLTALYKRTEIKANTENTQQPDTDASTEVNSTTPIVDDETPMAPRRVVLEVAAVREEVRLATTARLANQRGAIITLGEDHYHNKYFFLSSQSQMYLHGIHHRNVSEPLLFVYTMGRVHCVNCNHIPPVYQSLSNSYPCEYLLKYAMQTHFTIIKKSLIALQAIKTAHSVFVGNPNAVAAYCQNRGCLPHTLTSKMISLEVGYLRCLEYRSGLYAAFINSAIAEVKKRYIRNVLSEGFIDLNQNNGYFSRDLYNGIRMLNSNTTATKLLGESGYLDVLKVHLKKNRVRVYCKSKAGPIGSVASNDVYSAFSTEEEHPSETSRQGKPVEQVHISSGVVLRRYSSGRDAAMLMDVSQSGISLCCKGVKPDAFGFKWRFYEEPVPPIVPISIEVLKSMKYGHKKSNPLPLPVTIETPTAYTRAHLADMQPTTVSVNYRLVKLKIEILNIVAILPFWSFHWASVATAESTVEDCNSEEKEPDDGETNNSACGITTDDVPMEVAQEKVPSEKSEHSDDDKESGDEKFEDDNSEENSTSVSRTTRSGAVNQSARNVPHIEEFRSFVREVQAASTPQVLLECMWKLVSVIPPSFFATPPKHMEYAICVADVANYLYTIDRTLRYEDIPLDLKYEHIDYRPRCNISAKCTLSNCCVKPAGHTSRCMSVTLADGYSRYAEFGQLKQMTQKDEPSAPSLGPMAWQSSVQHRPVVAPPTVVTQYSVQQMLAGDIQFVQPFVPRSEDVRESTWV